MAAAVRYDFERGLGSVLDLVAVIEDNPQKRAKIIDKLARKRVTIKAQKVRFGDIGREAYAISIADLKWVARELGNSEALMHVIDTLERQIRAHKIKDKRASRPVKFRYDAQRGIGSVYDFVAMCRGTPVIKIQQPLLEKYDIFEDNVFQFPGKGQRPTPVAPYETLKQIACDFQSPEAYAALEAAASAPRPEDEAARQHIRFDSVTMLGALYDVCTMCGCPRSALQDFAPTVSVSHAFSETHVPAAPPDVLAAAAYHLRRPDVAAAILRTFPGRSVVFPHIEITCETMASKEHASAAAWVTPDMVLARYGEYVRHVRSGALPSSHKTLHRLSESDWHHVFGVFGLDTPAQNKKAPDKLSRLDVRYEFSDVWIRKLYGRFVSLLDEARRPLWYYWPAAEERTLWTLLENAAVGLLADELVARGVVALEGSVSLWKLVDAAGALGRREGARLAHTATSHLAYDIVQAKCRSEFGPWPAWRGIRSLRFDFQTNKPVRGLIVGSDNVASPSPPLFLNAWPGVRAELCRYGGAMPARGKETFFVVRGMSLLGDDQKDLEGVECVM